AACTSVVVESGDQPIAGDVALIGETRNQHSLANYEWYTVAGIDKRWGLVSPEVVQRGQVKFFRTSPGPHAIHVRLLATAHRGFPGLRDEFVVFENVELDGGKAYVVTGTRRGEMLDVWIEDQRTHEHITF